MISCLKNCRPGDVIVWKDNKELQVVAKEVITGWPIVMAVDYSGIQTGRRATVSHHHLGLVSRIIKSQT